ncbi:hypothetical protein D3OALGA1CA_2820 [Olavius algarvensis associated proteobacterium Delta 3]|nr:hypothetical protein D3OALGA1CA_2820 [Olavius algarvensis associated proteobacterium Delta 3]CAB5163770.1 hypothetical protein D3OALGB2SA_5605 [Olavius algarvensis associated proteobacterium Delta 3]
MAKYIHVHTDDPQQKMVNLIISGPVDKFATITPKIARLYGKIGKPARATVSIVQEKKYPFRLVGPNEHEKKNIRYTISELNTGQNKGYRVTIENIKQDKGRYFEVLKLKTDSTIRPEIQISVHGYISE